MDKAQKALASAKILLDAGDTDGATNRAYYAMFDAAIAALSWAGTDVEQSPPKTHSGLITSFGQALVRTEKLSAESGRALNRVQELRLTADYWRSLCRATKHNGRFRKPIVLSLLSPHYGFSRSLHLPCFDSKYPR